MRTGLIVKTGESQLRALRCMMKMARRTANVDAHG